MPAVLRSWIERKVMCALLRYTQHWLEPSASLASRSSIDVARNRRRSHRPVKGREILLANGPGGGPVMRDVSDRQRRRRIVDSAPSQSGLFISVDFRAFR